MKKQLLALSLIQGLALQPLMAENLNQYREGLLKSIGTTQMNSQERLMNLRTGLGTAGTPQIALQSSVANEGSKHQLYSSIIMKNILQNGVEEVMQARQYNARIPLDPTWTPEEHKMILALEDRKVCVNAIMNSRRDANGKADGMDQVVNELYTKAVEELNSEKKTTGGLANSDMNLAGLIARHAEQGPKNTEGASILGVLGGVTQAEVVDGLVHRVNFQKNGESMPLSLSTMLTFRVGEDDAFVQTQDCLLEYLKDQRDVFKARLEQKESYTLTQMFTNAYNKFMAYWNQVEQSKYNVATNSDQQKKAAAEVREMHQMIQTTDPTAQLLAKLKFFSEGHNKLSKDESDFMNQRLQLSGIVIPFLEARAAQAHKTNTALKTLSLAQVNYLTDMFLQLRGTDLPTTQDMAAMGELFATAATGSQDQKALERLNADSMYYQVIGKQLTSLENRLAQERDSAAAKQKDLEQIRN